LLLFVHKKKTFLARLRTRGASRQLGGRMTQHSAIGCISGTSMDGIDVAQLSTDGGRAVRPGPGRSYPYPPPLRRKLLAFLAEPARAETDPLTELEAEVSDAHADAIARFIAEHALPPPELVGCHGQTVWHHPQRRFTRQLGDGARIAARLGLPVVNRFRHADLAAGGQGAPLAPLYHQALAAALPQPVMVLNLGGVGNVSYIDGDTVIAFDTGPASALLDDFMLKRRNLPYDDNGALAASGTPDRALLATLLAHPYFTAPAPKSLDRNHFHAWAEAVAALPDAAGAATLAESTVASIAASLHQVPGPPSRWLVGGGGRHNAHVMRRLRETLHVPVEPVEAVGWHGDFIEAECFGYLAVRSTLGLPLSLPATTGAPRPMPGGELWTP
jgi:anhydro-N-acetylmuramic acid kinase